MSNNDMKPVILKAGLYNDFLEKKDEFEDGTLIFCTDVGKFFLKMSTEDGNDLKELNEEELENYGGRNNSGN